MESKDNPIGKKIKDDETVKLFGGLVRI